MTKTGWAFLLASCLSASAQITVELALDQTQFLRDESMPIKVRINNRSGQTLRLGHEPGWLTFHIESRDGFSIPQRDTPLNETPFALESGSAATRRVDLMDYYGLSRPGRYTVSATLRIKDWGQEIITKTKEFDVIPGFKLWEHEFGVPAKEGTPETRKYTLQQARYSRQLLLYARLSDAEDTRVFRVQPLGPIVSFGNPDAQIDKLSNLHVLFQTGARAFYYVVVGPHGDVLQRETHEYLGKSRPMLRASDNGSFFVSGGSRRRSPDDLPVLAAESSDAPAAKP